MLKGSLFSKLLLAIAILFSSVNIKAMNKTNPKEDCINEIYKCIKNIITDHNIDIDENLNREIYFLIEKKLMSNEFISENTEGNNSIEFTRKIKNLILYIEDFIINKDSYSTSEYSDSEEYSESEDPYDIEKKLVNTKASRKIGKDVYSRPGTPKIKRNKNGNFKKI